MLESTEVQTPSEELGDMERDAAAVAESTETPEEIASTARDEGSIEDVAQVADSLDVAQRANLNRV